MPVQPPDEEMLTDGQDDGTLGGVPAQAWHHWADGGSEPTGGGSGGGGAAQGFFAACDVGPHRPWIGPTRGTREAAVEDAAVHNSSCAAQGAVVVG
ncbi:MAG: hypothetical protein HZY73_02845 [Micropruina sp.]|nr:MAG: hypothetical protein HZY73_02845 [Micropruina sp.]